MKPLRVLLVEDSEDDAALILRALSRGGFAPEAERVQTVDAMKLALTTRPWDLVISDHNIPPFDGEAALRLKQEFAPHLPFILVTGSLNEETAVEYMKTGAADYILKDRLTRLVPAVTSALERKQAEVEMARLAAIVESAEDAVMGCTLEGTITNWNAGAERLTGYGAAEAVGRSAVMLLPAERQHQVTLLLQQVNRGDRVSQFETLVKRKDGAPVNVSISLAPVLTTNGRLSGVSIIARDISERLRAEDALRNYRDFLRRVIDATPNLIFVKDWEGRFTLVNQAVAEVYGTSPELLVGKTDADFNPNREEVEHYLRDDREVMATRQTKLIPEEAVTNPATGTSRWFQTVKVPLVSLDGTVRHLLGISTDITERKNLEEQLYQSQKMEAVGRLAGGIAHDFNNLLTAIIGSADLLQEGLGADDSRRRDVEDIFAAAQRAAGLTGQLLAFSRKQVLRPTALNLNEVVANIDRMLQRVIGEDIELRAVLGADLGTVKADAGQVEQVLLNLTVNARDAMPEGGKLTIETANVDLDEAYARDHIAVRPGPYVMVAVSDTGMGMSPEVKARIFEPFFTTKEKGKGTGLGLATVYGVVKQSGGNIWVYSEPGEGTTFKVYLPRVDEAPQGLPALTPKSSARQGTETILLVEDEETVRALVRRVLERLGYTVLLAAGAEEALRHVETHPERIHLLVSDVVMPGMGGRELAGEINKRRPGIRVLHLSGYTDSAVLHHGVLSPGTFFLQKPFTPQALAQKVREVLEAT